MIDKDELELNTIIKPSIGRYCTCLIVKKIISDVLVFIGA